MSNKKKKPIWMPLYVAEFIADTAHLTAAQGWAYINLLCAMWRSDDGTLPHDADHLARAGKVYHRQNWSRIWKAIKSLFDVDGDRVTSAPLQSELGKANALIVSRRAAASIGGRTTQFRRSMKAVQRTPISAPKPLIYHDGAQANAQANYNYNRKEKEEGEALPLPRMGEASASLKEEASSGEVVASSPPNPQSPAQTEGPFDESPLGRALQNWGDNVKRSGGSAK